MGNESPSLHAVRCGLDDCDWNALRSTMVGLYGELEDHLKDEHGYTEEEWRDARNRLEAGN